MASSESRRRKQLEKKKKKRSDKRHQIVVRRNAGLADQLAMRAKAPIYECFTSSTLDSEGLGEVVISRKSASGEIAMGVFLMDRYCMGVKDCFGRLVSGAEFEDFKENLKAKGLSLKKIDASSARRLIEDAIAYAEDLGIKPHANFRSARMIFGDIDPAEATTLFEMGKDGKPYFMSGPYQSPAECQMIIAKLTAKCGVDGFHYVMAIDPSHELLTGTHFDELSFDDDTDEFDDEDEVNQSSFRLEDLRS
ncbi:MAG: hypothetical protein R3C17_01280 [Planctomycetaceae bacterium]